MRAMQRGWMAVIGVVGAAAATAVSCNDVGSSNSAAIRACRAYCDTVIAAGCPMPIYASAGTCKAYECSSLESASERCQSASKAYYDCAAARQDLCADTGCARELDAAFNCGGAGRSGLGGRGGAGGRAAGGRGGLGGGGTAGAGGGWTPTLLGPRLVVWLDASQETGLSHGAEMAQWIDRSGANNNALQPLSLNRPVYSTQGINGLPTVTFRGTNYFVASDSPSLRFGTDDFAVMVVARGSPATNANAALLLKMETVPPFRGLVLYLNATPAPSLKAAIRIDPGLVARTMDDVSDSNPRLLGGRLFGQLPSASVLEIRGNGVAKSAIYFTPRVDISAPGLGLVIGYRGPDMTSGFYPFEGAISEVVIVRGTLADGELAALEHYLMAKYGLF